MAQVTYRGVKYDSEEYNAKVLAEAAQRERHELMYRGLKVPVRHHLAVNFINKEGLDTSFFCVYNGNVG